MCQSSSTSVMKFAKPARRAFVFFSGEHKATIRKATGLGKGRQGRKDLDSKVADSWKFLPQEHREKYVQMEAQDKLRFKREVASGLPVKQSPKKVPKKLSSALKKPCTAFFFFAKAHRQVVLDKAHAAGEDMSIGARAVSTRLGKAWRAMSEEEKQPYVVQSAQALEEHNQAKEAHLGAQAKRQQGKKSKKDPDMPKRYLTAFMLFAQANRQRVKASFAHAATTPEVSRALGAEWMALSNEQKLPFEQEAAADQARFREEMQAYRLRKNGQQQSANGLAGASKAKTAGAAAKSAKTVKKHSKRSA